MAIKLLRSQKVTYVKVCQTLFVSKKQNNKQIH